MMKDRLGNHRSAVETHRWSKRAMDEWMKTEGDYIQTTIDEYGEGPLALDFTVLALVQISQNLELITSIQRSHRRLRLVVGGSLWLLHSPQVECGEILRCTA